MGRQLRRVPLDFAWPLHEVWGGYLNPHYRACTKCKTCDGTGYSPEAKRFHDEWWGYSKFDPIAYGSEPLRVDDPIIEQHVRQKFARYVQLGYGTSTEADVRREIRRMWEHWSSQWHVQLSQADVDALVAAERLPRELTQEWNGERWVKIEPPPIITPAILNAHTILAPIANPDEYTCMKARITREGVVEHCAICKGEGEVWTSPEAEKRAEDWKQEEPPKGDGYQLWETTSEGSPISPVFATLDELCAHAEKHCSTFGGGNFVSKERWREMLDADHVVHQEGNMVFF